VLWSHSVGIYRTDVTAWMLRHLPMKFWTGLQYGALAVEFAVPVLLCISRLRWAGIILGLVFHLMIALMMKELIYFSLQIWTFYALFVSAGHWRTHMTKFSGAGLERPLI
jgi:hypothetical protein